MLECSECGGKVYEKNPAGTSLSVYRCDKCFREIKFTITPQIIDMS